MAAMNVTLRWTGEALRFEGGGAGSWVALDGNAEAGPSPMQAVLLGFAGCMAADVIEILGKMRVPLAGLSVKVEGERAPEPPRRFTAIRLVYEVEGVPPEGEDKLARAIELSKEKYCSVLHSLRPDIDFRIEAIRR
jgi:putative redox protein